MQSTSSNRASRRIQAREERRAKSKPDLMSPLDVEIEAGIPQTTQAVWRCTNRYGFRDLVIKVGSSVRYRRTDIEAWLESRRASTLAEEAA